MTQNNSYPSPESLPPQPGVSAEQLHAEAEHQRLLGVVERIDQSVESAYAAGDSQGAEALQRAQGVLTQRTDGEAFAGAQRQIEFTVDKGAWTDEVRAVAVELNQEQQQNNGEQPLSFADALSELKEYQATWKEAAKRDGDEWLDNNANTLGYMLNGARRGEPDRIDGVLKQVEGMLGSALSLSDKERGAGELRALRDALFTEKQRILQAEQQQATERAEHAQKTTEAEQARSAVAEVFDAQPPKNPEEALPKLVREQSTNERLAAAQEQITEILPEDEPVAEPIAAARAQVAEVFDDQPVEQESSESESEPELPQPVVQPQPKEAPPQEVDKQEVLDSQQLLESQGFIGQYFNGPSGQIMHGIISKLSSELKQDPGVLYERFKSGAVTVDGETKQLIDELRSDGLKPGSPGWGTQSLDSMLGRIEAQSTQTLEQILRRMLS